MSLLDRVNTHKSDTGMPNRFANVSDSMFGTKPLVPEPAVQQVYDEPEDTYDYQAPQHQNRQLDLFEQAGSMMSSYRKDNAELINDEYLLSLAKLEVKKLFFGASLKIEPIRIVAARTAKFLGKPELAQKIKDQETMGGHAEFKELLQEVIFQELKDLQRNDNLRLPTGSELMDQHFKMILSGIAGENFTNLTELVDAGIEKAKPLFNKKK
jgi:hypothetical protein